MMPQNTVTQESQSEVARVQRMAEQLGLKFDEVVRAGSQGTVVGIQSKALLFSHRTDSLTFFVQDSRFGLNAEHGVLDAPDAEHLRAAHQLAGKLNIPAGEIVSAQVTREQNQVAEVDRATGKVNMGPRGRGKAYARFSRQVDGIPVWSSRVVLGLKRDGGIGFLEAHWPEIPGTALIEVKRLAEMIGEGWKPPEHPGSKPVTIEAGIIHSPAAGFVMDIYPVIRVVYEPNDPRYSKRPVLYLDRHGNAVPIPRQFVLDPQTPPGKRPLNTGPATAQ